MSCLVVAEGKRTAELFNFMAFSCGASTNIVNVEEGLEDYQVS